MRVGRRSPQRSVLLSIFFALRTSVLLHIQTKKQMPNAMKKIDIPDAELCLRYFCGHRYYRYPFSPIPSRE